ncbi:hypothetical protein [Streptomyces noursei]|uniref:Resolvase/invertase-type recombinase catalytic domain-containing protein n=1 Tax=Streptomyces noursei TaxID=1971 RepID=A0A2N8PR28_STRNR|nr:hypothetical protein [Streptomyces noursei]PNE43495.1 hypothetical protein AOB60_00840 [Streptomyces noursei]
MTSQSTTRASSTLTDWMDRDNEINRWLRPNVPRVASDRLVQLMKLRREQMERRLEALRVRGRVPRIVLYARTVNGQSPDRSLAAAREFAERMGWQSGDQTFTDCRSLATPEDRYGWLQIKQHVTSGYADGVVALTRAAISPQLDEYETELNWFAGHSGGFIALVHAENVVPQ